MHEAPIVIKVATDLAIKLELNRLRTRIAELEAPPSEGEIDKIAQALFMLDWESENWHQIIESKQEIRAEAYRSRAKAAIETFMELRR